MKYSIIFFIGVGTYALGNTNPDIMLISAVIGGFVAFLVSQKGTHSRTWFRSALLGLFLYTVGIIASLVVMH